MKKNLPLFSLLFGTIFLTSTTEAQQPDQFAYAVTDGQQAANWSFLRKLNLQTGEYSAVLLSGDDISLPAYDATSKKQFTSPLKDANYGNALNAPFGTGVAAMAFDKKNNRLYFTPMFIDQLRYLDIKDHESILCNRPAIHRDAAKITRPGQYHYPYGHGLRW
ncbi:MAG: hypothetical protein IPO53_00865 [Chitinophagaceae bacterium]|nr:hypothetical protein [Chitinophagaceae bacterium]